MRSVGCRKKSCSTIASQELYVNNKLDEHLIIAFAGLTADARVLIGKVSIIHFHFDHLKTQTNENMQKQISF